MTTTREGGAIRAFFRFAPWFGAAAVLGAAAVAEQVWDEMAWTAFDFAVVAVLALAVLLPWEIAMRTRRSPAYLAGVAFGLGAAALLFVSIGAVGVIGSEDNPANLLFYGVLALWLGGAVGGGFHAEGMARAGLAAAIAQAAVGSLALASGWGAGGPSWPVDVAVATAVFTLAWTISALAFRQAVKAG